MMIDYLPYGSDDCPLLRIYGSNTAEFIQLISAIRAMMTDGGEMAVHDLPCFNSLGMCKLYFRVGQRDDVIAKFDGRYIFSWELSYKSWEMVVQLIEPFCLDTNKKFHQWIAGEHSFYGLNQSPIALLITNREDGCW